MRNTWKTLFGLAILWMSLGFSSCFDILEEYEFNADGSGKAKMEIDMTKLVTLMQGFAGAMDSTGEGGGDDKMNEMFQDSSSIESLRKIPGIKNVMNLNNAERMVIGYSFEFESIEALNTAFIVQKDGLAMGNMLGKMGGGDENETENDNSITYTGKKFKRSLEMKLPEADEDEDDETKQGMEMAKMMFADAKYTLRYAFPTKVKKVKGNESAVIGADGKTVTVENTLGDLLEGKSTMSTDIRLK